MTLHPGEPPSTAVSPCRSRWTARGGRGGGAPQGRFGRSWDVVAGQHHPGHRRRGGGVTGPGRSVTLPRAGGGGVGAGVVGAGPMPRGERVERGVAGPRSPCVLPGALRPVLGARPAETSRPPVANHLMHWSTGALL